MHDMEKYLQGAREYAAQKGLSLIDVINEDIKNQRKHGQHANADLLESVIASLAAKEEIGSINKKDNTQNTHEPKAREAVSSFDEAGKVDNPTLGGDGKNTPPQKPSARRKIAFSFISALILSFLVYRFIVGLAIDYYGESFLPIFSHKLLFILGPFDSNFYIDVMRAYFIAAFALTFIGYFSAKALCRLSPNGKMTLTYLFFMGIIIPPIAYHFHPHHIKYTATIFAISFCASLLVANTQQKEGGSYTIKEKVISAYRYITKLGLIKNAQTVRQKAKLAFSVVFVFVVGFFSYDLWSQKEAIKKEKEAINATYAKIQEKEAGINARARNLEERERQRVAEIEREKKSTYKGWNIGDTAWVGGAFRHEKLLIQEFNRNTEKALVWNYDNGASQWVSIYALKNEHQKDDANLQGGKSVVEGLDTGLTFGKKVYDFFNK